MRTALILALLLAAAPPAGADRWLLWTNPAENALIVDSTVSDCSGGDPLGDLATIRIWQWPITGGLPRVLIEKNVRGKEGRPDSALVPEGAQYYLTAIDTTGRNESCASNMIYIGPVTAVPSSGPPDLIQRIRIFDVRGRRVSGRLASGIYFFEARYRSGRIRTGKLPIVR